MTDRIFSTPTKIKVNTPTFNSVQINYFFKCIQLGFGAHNIEQKSWDRARKDWESSDMVKKQL